MKKKRKRKAAGMSTEMMVDVLFILLIFFILVSNIKKDNIKIKTAKVNKEDTSQSDQKTIEHVLTIDKENQIFFNGKKVTSPKDLQPLLEQTKKDIPTDHIPMITLRTDTDSSSGKLLEIFVSLNEAGLADNVQCEVDRSP